MEPTNKSLFLSTDRMDCAKKQQFLQNDTTTQRYLEFPLLAYNARSPEPLASWTQTHLIQQGSVGSRNNKDTGIFTHNV